MTVYVESNFVLEQSLQQEECDSCAELIDLASKGRILLAAPAFSLAEPHAAILGKEKARFKLSNDLRHTLVSSAGRNHIVQFQQRSKHWHQFRSPELSLNGTACTRRFPASSKLPRLFRSMPQFSGQAQGYKWNLACRVKMPSFLHPCSRTWIFGVRR
jgi:hypothetical protein